MTNLMVAHLAFKAEEDPDVALYAFKKHITVQVSLYPNSCSLKYETRVRRPPIKLRS